MDTIRYLVLQFWNQGLVMYRTMIIKAELKRRKAIANTQYLSKCRSGDLVHDQEESCNSESPKASTSSAVSMYQCHPSEMKRVFDLFDENKDGLVCSKELQVFMKRLGFDLSEETVCDMVGSVDRNGDKHLDFDEFLSLYSSICEGRGDLITENDNKNDDIYHGRESDDEVEGSLLQAFFVFDENKDGLISAVELQHVLLKLGFPEGRSLMGCQKMIERVDTDGNGKVDFFEFKEMMCSNLLTSCA